METKSHGKELEERLAEALSHHIRGWHEKINDDFCKENYENELKKLEGDPVYSKFGFAIPQYVLIRLMGRISISIGRRLGEIYDKVPRFVAAARFGLDVSDVSPKLDGLELDIGIKRNKLSEEDNIHLLDTLSKFFTLQREYSGIGIEIRYNFNPNDSARLRKDVKMATLLMNEKMLPIYLIFSEISPRDEAIARLTRAGWNFLVGEDAEKFMSQLIGLNFSEVLDHPKIKSSLQKEITDLMDQLFSSYAFLKGSNRNID